MKTKNKKEQVHAVVEIYGGVIESIRIFRSRDKARRTFKAARADMERRGVLSDDCAEWDAFDGDLDEEAHIYEDIEIK